MPNELTSIGGKAFSGCRSLAAVNIPAGVTEWKNNPFANCPRLTITLAPKHPSFLQFKGVICSADKTTILHYSANKRQAAFIPPKQITTIGAGAFSGCLYLRAAALPPTLETVQDEAFSNCANLTTIQFRNPEVALGKGVFSNCTALRSIALPEKCTELPENLFSGCTKLTQIKFPAELEKIGDGVFEKCAGLRQLSFPKSVGSIGKKAFSGCIYLDKITFPENLSELGENAFEKCIRLQDIRLPEGVSAVKKNTFSGCISLRRVILPKSVENVEEGAFDKCEKLTKVTTLNPDLEENEDVFGKKIKLVKPRKKKR